MKSPANIQAVTFDVGGTLIEPWPSVGHVYAEVAARHGGAGLSPEVLNQRFAAAWQVQSNFTYTREAWADLVDETFGDQVAAPPSRTFFPELYERFTQANAWRIFDDVEPTLTELSRRGVRLGIISNWDERLRPLLASLGLAHKFEVMVVSCEAGATKPSPVIFQQAAAGFGLNPGDILHVGDHKDLDLTGAQCAGLKAVQVRRAAKPAQPGQIQSLAGLLDLI